MTHPVPVPFGVRDHDASEVPSIALDRLSPSRKAGHEPFIDPARTEAFAGRVPARLKRAMQFQARTDDGMRLFTVTAVIGDMVALDGNHPLADQTLHFDVQIVGVREATTEELEHGHVHGAGGHHH